jgi:hypothetical protein
VTVGTISRGLRAAVKIGVGDRLLGVLDYVRSPQRGRAWGGPFNGQTARQSLFLGIVRDVAPKAIIETGVYLGTTTQFMAATGLRVFAIESNDRYYGFSRARLWRHLNVTLVPADSRAGLRALFAGRLSSRLGEPLFFYLDAHWNDDLPLAEELRLIFEACRLAVVMVDDFQVPGEAGYGYDDYGPGKALTLDYIAPAVASHGLAVYFPTVAAHSETGLRRGCVVLSSGAVDGLDRLPLLRREATPV